MSAKKKPVLLGPDGKALDAAKYRKRPEAKREGAQVTMAIVDEARLISTDISSLVINYGSGGYSLGFSHPKTEPETKGLRDAVAEQITAIAADFEGAGVAELPKPARDLGTYRDAYASAAENCLHDDAVEMLYQREWVCDACGRRLNRDDMRRASAKRGSFRWFGS